MIKIKNKFNIDDLVFAIGGGYIIHCKVSGIRTLIDSDKNELFYYIRAIDGYYNRYLDDFYREEELCSSLEDVANIMEVH